MLLHVLSDIYEVVIYGQEAAFSWSRFDVILSLSTTPNGTLPGPELALMG